MNNKTNKEWKQRKGRNLPEQKSWCADKTRDRQRPGDKAKCTSMSVFNQEKQEKRRKMLNMQHKHPCMLVCLDKHWMGLDEMWIWVYLTSVGRCLCFLEDAAHFQLSQPQSCCCELPAASCPHSPPPCLCFCWPRQKEAQLRNSPSCSILEVL